MDLPSRSRFDISLDKAPGSGRPRSRLSLAFAAVLIAGLAFVVRSLYAVDGAPLLRTPEQPGTRMAARYDQTALGILAGEGILFPRNPPAPGDTSILARPPGYPAWLALVYRAIGHGFLAAQLAQNALNAAACAMLAVAVARLVSFGVGIVAGVLAAISPHLAYTSNLLLADSIAAVPILVALALLARAARSPLSWPRVIAAGAFLGVATWLRPNAMLMGPFFVPFVVLASRDRRAGLVRGVAVALVSLAVVAPITIRNAIVFGEFVPVSINGGITLWEGVAAAGGVHAGARQRDKLVIAEEAERYGNPRYAEWWASPNGIERDRDRYARAWAVIRRHPWRYVRLMASRMRQMVDYAAGEAPRVAERDAIATARASVGDEEGAIAAPESPGAVAAWLPVSDDACLATGRAMAAVRAPVRWAQGATAATMRFLVLFGALMFFATVPRVAIVLAAVPLYYFIFESMFIYEWRVATPMHYFLFTFAAGAWIAVGRFVLRRAAQKAAGRQVTR